MKKTKKKKLEIEAILIFCSLVIMSVGLGYSAYSASTGFNVGLRVIMPPQVLVQWAVPEGRVGAPGTNWDELFYVYTKSSDGATFLDSFATPQMLSVQGTYLTTTTFTNMDSAGIYDVYLKGWQHISRKLNDVYLGDMVPAVLNYSQTDNSSPLGSVVLLAGDISGVGNSTTTMGDDVINAVDLGIMIDRLDEDDPTGNVIRANLNQDVVVNSVDMSLLLKNLDAEGDR